MPISPPALGLSFGSFGDIVTVLQLAWELRAALDESAGASAELRALVGDVDAFTRALQDVQENIERRRRNLRPDVLNGIAAALSRCRGVLSAIQQRIARARGQTSASGWHKYWGAAAWSILGGKKDVEALRARLSEQLGIMQLYLSLSEANSQERVQDVMVEHGTTLQRIYSVVQDIQLRFDVGVPGFQFYSHHTRRYYPPLARTSLQRLREVSDALRGPYDSTMSSFLREHCGITDDDFIHLPVIYKAAKIPIELGGRNPPMEGHVEVYFFREAAFGAWQALVSPTSINSYLDRVLKTLLERPHTVGADCNCPVACGTRYRDDVNELAWRLETAKAYSEVASILFEHLQPTAFEPGWIMSLLTAFDHWPDPEQLRLTVPSILSRQRLSPGDMVDLISNTPTGRAPADPADHMAYGYSDHAVLFRVDGTTLCETLLGHVQPVFDGPVLFPARLPDWGRISIDETDEGQGQIPNLVVGSGDECRCYECSDI